MDYRKVDAMLAAALDDVQDQEECTLTVFIHTVRAPDNVEATFLEKLGVSKVTGGRQVFSATLSVRAVAELSDQPWVRSLKLSKKLYLLNER